MTNRDQWLTVPDQISSYLQAIDEALADDSKFSTFKQDFRYQYILEHLGRERGAGLWSFLKDKVSEEDILKCQINDVFGSPQVYEYDGVTISPTTLRYIKSAYYLNKMFGSLDNFSILEVGGGYGGLCTVLNTLYDIQKYTLVDLEGPGKLQDKYIRTIENYGTSIGYRNSNIKHEIVCSLDDLGDCEEYDLIISEFAFSELDMHLQKQYLSKFSLISKGYIGSNACYDRAEQFFGRSRMLNNIDIVEALKDNNAALRGVYDSHPSGEAEDLGVIYWGCTLSEEEKSKKRIEYNEVIINQFKESKYDEAKIKEILTPITL